MISLSLHNIPFLRLGPMQFTRNVKNASMGAGLSPQDEESKHFFFLLFIKEPSKD